tara:strand:+ start:625 stop:1035 length:411 start_codon:yes stop_codon:yes gene_type:complete
MADSRNKGAAFERQIVRRLNAFFDECGAAVQCKRNLDQYQSNNLCDIEIPGYAIECKAYKSGWWFAPAWWKQVVTAANDKTPVLVWKFNNKPIRVTVPIYALNESLERDNEQTVVMDFDHFLQNVLEKNFRMSEAA